VRHASFCRDLVVINSSKVAGFIFACATLFLSACTIAPLRQAETAVPTADQPFAIDGRLSAKRGSDGAAANFAWNHDGGRDRIDFASPFGQVYARVDGNNDRIVVERPGGATESYPNWHSMTVALLGAPVPMDDLAFWIRGAARADASASVERDALGRVLVLRQREWEIVYTYPDNASAALPSRVFLKQQGVETVEVRIVVDRWGAALATR
jgi:outer membrane lipoprotein LolB